MRVMPPKGKAASPLKHWPKLNLRTMQIEFNGEAVETADQLSLYQFLEQYKLQDRKGIAVAVDNNVVPRASWPETWLGDGKKIVVFTAAQGG